MKKLVLFSLFFLIAALPAQSQFVIGLDAGVSFINEDTKDLEDDFGADVRKIGFPALLELGYKLPTRIEVPGLGDSEIIAGIKLGFMNGTRVEIDLAEVPGLGLNGSWDLYWNTVPVYLFSRFEAERIFTEVNLGLHAWFFDSDVDSGNALADSMLSSEDNGLDFSANLKFGLIFPFSEKASGRAGLSIQTLNFDGDDVSTDDNMLAIGAFFGFSYSL